MTNHVSRRNLLRLGAATAVLPWLPSLAAVAASAAETPMTSGALAAARAVRPFKLSDVSLGPGVFARKRELILNFARGYDERRYANVFRANAGLRPVTGVVPLPAGGWEGLDGEANGNLRGHFTGHHLSMLAQAYASTGEEVFGTKLRSLVGSLHECRQALSQEPEIQALAGRFSGTAVDVARGSNVYGQLPAGSVNGLQKMTFAAWVRPTAAANWARIFDFGNNTKSYAFLAQRDGQGLPRFAITQNWAGGEQKIVGNAPLPLNEWSHVAVTLDGQAGTLYVNGQQAGKNTAMTLTPALLGSLANVWLGRSQYSDPTFAGAYDDVNIWSSALTAGQIGELAAARASATSAGHGDVVALACSETSGSLLADASGKGRHATLRRTWGLPSHPGFLAAYPETQFIELESRTTPDYFRVWAPYYTAHKILKGLLDAYTATGEPQALDLAGGLCDWMHSRLSRLTPAVRQRMWGIFSSGEFGGIVEAILETHGHSGKPEHLELATYFDLDSLIDACAQNRDILTGLHANQHIPIFTGLVLLYNKTGEDRYLAAARNFWGMVVPTRMFSIGGTSQGEFWKERDRIAGTLHESDAESCCAYNLLKLSRELFFRDQNPAYMDYYERTLFNQVLGSKQDQDNAEMPLVTYFVALQPGAVRDFTPKQGTTCCEGTGLESATKYQDSVYFTDDDGSALYINLYVPSTLRWAGKDITVTQKTTFPFEQRTTLQIAGSGQFELRLRVPAWATAGLSVRVNGALVDSPAAPGSYIVIDRAWNNGDTVDVEMPFALRSERALDDPTVQTLMYGPVNLVARDARTTFLPFSLYGASALNGDLAAAVQPIAGKPLHFTLAGVELAPFFEGTADPFHTYFRRAEPSVVFGGVESGVANPTRANKSTLLDDVWQAAPFANKAELLRRVNEVTGAWVTEGTLSTADADRIFNAAQRAAFADPAGEIDDLQDMASSALAAGRITAEANDQLAARLKLAQKALAGKTTAKAVHNLEQYVDAATRAITDQALRELLLNGAQALIVRLTS
ncbi:beta-L-arabinofuranosidase domain-containing protein [Arthrobacter sp. CJ23]|uniref:beta-L-arabinofuranosidase domain-containing protein n=1 Tax=Arthrobacter sp. CJ23 TaxID=2972479 RepID=UPI00215D187F|nr:beta-L-arabinofuranosidase domain-containing protein [Arthrobacter sp. CJ23]UVJ39808.1 glycoside hydrolase family 127 protein [Arthrobacter sp. CJ23]